jgi:hypothetical protein
MKDSFSSPGEVIMPQGKISRMTTSWMSGMIFVEDMIK